jgi:hypothetical protein
MKEDFMDRIKEYEESHKAMMDHISKREPLDFEDWLRAGQSLFEMQKEELAARTSALQQRDDKIARLRAEIAGLREILLAHGLTAP